ncbi:MAG: endonuclease III [Hyphomicrobiales bacterium]|nr:MAG: endonuclease III [Hyphomicrobiales bacterium]
MIKAERVKNIIKILDRIYPDPPIPLDHKNIFELLISVLLSAQCTDIRVNQVTPSLFQLANNAKDMSRIDLSVIYEIIRPCGLAPQKSAAIKELSEILIRDFNGKVPDTYKELEILPGVGHKTASVVMSQGHGHPAFPVDTHIHRLAQRWGLTNGKSVVQTEKDLKRLFPKENWNRLHLQIIFYGREYCQARACFGIDCEICSTCYPDRKKPLKVKKP